MRRRRYAECYARHNAAATRTRLPSPALRRAPEGSSIAAMGEGCFEAIEGPGHRDLHRVTVAEAARILGVTESAVRKRVQRGHIPYDKEESGRVYVYLDTGQSRRLSGKVTDGHASRSREARPGQSRDRYVRSLEERNAFLEEQVKRQMEVIADLVRRVPELEAPSETPQAPQTPPEPSEDASPRSDTVEAQEDAQRVRQPWWVRWFGAS